MLLSLFRINYIKKGTMAMNDEDKDKNEDNVKRSKLHPRNKTFKTDKPSLRRTIMNHNGKIRSAITQLMDCILDSKRPSKRELPTPSVCAPILTSRTIEKRIQKFLMRNFINYVFVVVALFNFWLRIGCEQQRVNNLIIKMQFLEVYWLVKWST